MPWIRRYPATLLAVVAACLAIGALAPQGRGAEPATQPATTQAASDRLLEAVGGLALNQLYQAYLNTGFLADGVGQGIYEEKNARPILATIVAGLKTSDKHLADIRKLSTDTADHASLAQLREICTLLQTQAAELTAYWDKKDQDHADKYEAARTKAWEKINPLLAGNG